jgi:hypothetical protein
MYPLMKWLSSLLLLGCLWLGSASAAPLVSTHYFYWYNVDTNAHVWDSLTPPDDALQDHPINLKMNPLNVQDPAWPTFSFNNTAWHQQQLTDIMDAGIEAIFPIYWGDTGNKNAWALSSLPHLVEAERNLEAAGKTPPRIGMFFDTSAIALQLGNNFSANLTTQAAKDVIYAMVHDFFTAIPQDLWAKVNNKPVIVTYGSFSYTYNQATWDYVYTMFQNEFGVRPYIVMDDAWGSAVGDVRCQWGAAPFGPVYHANDLNWANVGPGFNNKAVPGGSLVRDREDGVFYQTGWLTLLNQMPSAKPGMLVETWNELHEGSDIAQTHEYGRRYINMTRFFVDLMKTAGSTGQALTVNEVDAINQIYWRLLRRGPDSPAIVPAALAIRGAGGNRAAYALSIMNSDERRQMFVNQAYQQMLNVAPSDTMRQSLLAQYAAGNDNTVLATILGSTEFFARAGNDNYRFVELLYRKLMGRWPSKSEQTTAIAQLAGGDSRINVALNVLATPAYHASLAAQSCSALVGSTTNTTLLASQQALLDANQWPEAVVAQLIASTDFINHAKASFGRSELQSPVVLQGQVVDQWTSQPLSGLQLTLTDPQGKFIAASETGVSAGGINFIFQVTPRPGVCTLHAIAPGYREQSTTVSLASGALGTIKLLLRTRQHATLDQSMDMAFESLEGVSMDPDTNGEAYHGFYLHPDGSVELAHALEIGIPHMTGRALDALMYAQDVRGTPLAADVENALTTNQFSSFNYPYHLNSYVVSGAPKVEFHNLREGLAGLNALIKYRNNAQAATVAHQMMQTLDSITLADGSFSDSLITAAGVPANGSQNGPTPGNSGRLVGSLMKYYRISGDALALSLAEKYSRHTLSTAFTDAGLLVGAATETGAGNHVHSITSTLSSVLMWVHDTQLGATSSGPVNMLTNPGWDAQTGEVALTGSFDNGSTFTGWQCYAIGGTPTGTSTFKSQADAAAVTAPNLFVFTLNTASGDSALRRDINPVAITAGHVYKCGVWVRDVDGTLNSYNFNTSLFGTSQSDYLGPFGGRADQAQTTWEKQEGSFIAPTAATLGSWGIRLTGPTASLQLDDAFLVDITNQDRMLNGGFENSSRLLEWTLSAVGGRSIQAQVVGGAAVGSRAVYLSQTNTVGDGVLGKDANRLPWTAGHTLRLHYQVKDSTTMATGESVSVLVSAFDSAGNVISHPFSIVRPAGTGSYASYTEDGIATPANTATVNVTFRICDAGGAPMIGDVLIDDVQVFDTSAGVVSSAELEKCKLIFDNAFNSVLRSSFGWVKEERRDSSGPGDSTRGEMNGTGDMLQSALFLAQSGFPEYYEVAERYMRSFVIPVQLLGVSALKERPTATEDRYLKMRRRAHGCFGFPMPNDRYDEAETHSISALDVTAGTLQAMCEFHRAIYSSHAGASAVHLLFNVDDTTMTIASDLPETGRVVVTPKLAGSLRVRIPSWAPRSQIVVKKNSVAATYTMQEPYLVLDSVAAGTNVEITFPLLQWTETEVIASRTYSVEWLGDEVTAVTPVGNEQKLFQANTPPTQLWGKVTESGNSTKPMEGCLVTLLTADGKVLGTGVTDAGGNYAVDVADLPTGSYTARAEFQGYYIVTKTGLAIESQIPFTEDFQLVVGASLHGNVLKYGERTPVGGATLNLFLGNTLVGTANTQSDGSYLFSTNLATGTYRLEISAPGYLAQSQSGIYITASNSRTLNILLKPDDTYNLMDNSGWDATTGVVSLGDATGTNFDSNSAFPGWQMYSIGGTPPGKSTFTVAAVADAVSGPNILTFKKDIASGDSAVRRDAGQVPVTAGCVYKTGVWLRDNDGSPNTLDYATTTFDSIGVLATGNLKATANWEKAEGIFKAPTGDHSASLNLRMGETIGQFQLDSAFVYDVTAGNRLTNPGFDNSTTRLLQWATFATGGRVVSATLSSNAASGARALRLSQTNAIGDGGVNRDATLVPWTGGQGFELGISLKDDTTLASGEYLQVQVCAFNALKQVIDCPLVANLKPGTGGYTSYTKQCLLTDDLCTWLGVSLRIVNASGAAVAGDVLIDDVSLRVLDLEPVNTSAVGTWQIYN